MEYSKTDLNWICINDNPVWYKKYDGYFTYMKTYNLDYADYENEDVYLILDNGRDDYWIDFNELINNFETLEDCRNKKLNQLGI